MWTNGQYLDSLTAFPLQFFVNIALLSKKQNFIIRFPISKKRN